ncbi:MAG: hypothetical protein A3J40_04185 [Erythrobacter sp. RIFCSPHIGHO2_12_FULL_63_10]|nr:MAG: hypothetical protein A3J40_04185 [Erythrobacter sp. RIFCSPHIGHO2_12_FULL_63_10]
MAALLLAGSLLWLWSAQKEAGSRTQVALMTSLPIYWSDGADVTLLASGQGELPWVRETLEARYRLKPVDTLGAAGQGDPLAGIDRLMVVQPRALSPQDNVALDQWVNDGGHLFMALDPLLTGQYSVPLGDSRHPAAVGLVPPVIARWGMDLRFDEAQPFAVRELDGMGIAIPVAMAGEIHPLPGAGKACQIAESGILASCKVGKGRVTILADAALFEFPEGEGKHRDVLTQLVARAFE